MRAPDARASLEDWLAWQSRLHPREMDLGLDRVSQVAGRLGLLPFPAQVITIAGTNGKGSCALTLECLLVEQATVGVYTSPYILRYNERVRINGAEASDAALCRAFAAVEAARDDVQLTYFEFGTLAALWLFLEARLDVLVLEVGMGGRLDAVNVIDADIAIITSIALDHTQWLGDTREAIGREKAGIMRGGCPVICADRDPPESVAQCAQACGAQLFQIGDHFEIECESNDWFWQVGKGTKRRIPASNLLLADNVGAVLVALKLAARLPNEQDLTARLADFAIPGRRQQIAGPVSLLLDVAHNPAAIGLLAQWLRQHPVGGRTIAVLGMLRDKAIAECAATLGASVDKLIAAGLPAVDRGATGTELTQQGSFHEVCETVEDAIRAAALDAIEGDRIVVCGSFYTVSEALAALPLNSLKISE